MASKKDSIDKGVKLPPKQQKVPALRLEETSQVGSKKG